jgi:tetratricopeptide (TPR) repeat protein
MRNRIVAPLFCILVCMVSILAATVSAQGQQDPKKQYDLALDQAIIHYEQFKIHLENNESAKAVKELRAIVAIEFPDGFEGSDGVLLQVDAHILLGEMIVENAAREKDAKKKTALLEEAVALFKSGLLKAPAVNELTYQLYMDLGHAYKLAGKKDDALKAFESAEKINRKLQEIQKQSKSG